MTASDQAQNFKTCRASLIRRFIDRFYEDLDQTKTSSEFQVIFEFQVIIEPFLLLKQRLSNVFDY